MGSAATGIARRLGLCSHRREAFGWPPRLVQSRALLHTPPRSGGPPREGARSELPMKKGSRCGGGADRREFDVKAEGLEASDEAALDGTGITLVEVGGAEVDVGAVVGQQVGDDHQQAVADGHRGLLGAAACAAWTRAARTHGLPLRVLPLRRLPALSLWPGHMPAREAKWPAVGKRLRSTPISASSTSAMRRPMPGRAARRAINSSKGRMRSAISVLSR